MTYLLLTIHNVLVNRRQQERHYPTPVEDIRQPVIGGCQYQT